MNAALQIRNPLRNLTDQELIQKVEALVRQEREIIEGLIWHLQEVQDRKIYIQMGYTSLYECLIKRFGFSSATAYSRISSLRIIAAVPDAANALLKGEVTLTSLSLTQTFIQKEEKKSGNKFSTQSKQDLLAAIKNKSTQEVKETLAALHPCHELPPDKVIYLNANDIQLLATTDKRLLEKIQKTKDLISHENINPNYHELLHLAFDALIEKKEKVKGFAEKKTPSASKEVTRRKSVKSAPAVEKSSAQLASAQDISILSPQTIASQAQHPSRYISRRTKRDILERSQGRCEYIHHNGLRCNSTFQLQFDHIQAFSKGGSSERENIQALCRIHNYNKADRIWKDAPTET